MIGQTVGNYRIVERLGEGGMGTVYRAVDEMLEREVAIKVLRPELARQAPLVERFRQEARALARLGHPRIATLHGMERHGDELLMVMEFVRGDTLEAVVQRSGRLAWPRAAELCAGVLDALDHAHDRQIVHRDIKPANVMLTRDGAVKVMDFGIARMLGRSRQTQFGHAVGTPTYMAPEQLRGEEVDRRTDLYAVGAVLFELITGRVAFEADSDYRLMMMQLNEPPPPPSSVVPDVPAEIDAIVARAMAKRPDDRYPDAAAFASALRAPALRATLAARAGRPAPAAVPLTRLETPRVTASHPAPIPVGAVAETRLAEPAHAGAIRAARPASHRDWRPWAVAAALVVAAAAGAIALDDPTGPAADPQGESGVATPSTAGAPAGPVLQGPAADSETASVAAGEAPAGRPREDASTLIINPPAAVQRPPVPAPPREDTPRAPRPPARGPNGARDGGARPPTGAPVAAPIAGPPAVVATKERDTPPPRAEGEGAARAAIASALVEAARVLSGRGADAAAPLLGGEVRAQWTALMREGRVSVGVDGTPTVRLDGDRASAEFDATVTVRSPFGANRRRPARFSAELQRSGDGWTVTSIRPVGSLPLT